MSDCNDTTITNHTTHTSTQCLSTRCILYLESDRTNFFCSGYLTRVLDAACPVLLHLLYGVDAEANLSKDTRKCTVSLNLLSLKLLKTFSRLDSPVIRRIALYRNVFFREETNWVIRRGRSISGKVITDKIYIFRVPVFVNNHP